MSKIIMKKFLSVEKILWVLLSLLNILFLVYWVALACNYQLHYDDVHFMWKLRDYSIFEYVREMYMTRGGNFVGYGKNGIIFSLANWTGDYHWLIIVNYIIGILYTWGACRNIANNINKITFFLGLLAIYNIYILTSIDVAVSMWLCAMGYYLAGPKLCLLVKYFCTPKLQWWQWILFGWIVLSISGGNVAFAIVAFCVMLALGLMRYHQHQWHFKETWADPLIKRLVFTTMAMLCVYALVVVAPGNYIRMDEFDIDQPANLVEFVKACCVCVGMFFYFMAFYLPYQLLAVGLGGYVGAKYKLPLKSKSFKRGMLVTIGAFFLYVAIAVMPLAYLSNGFQIQRNYTHISFFYMVMLFVVGYMLGCKLSKPKMWAVGSLVCSIFLCAIMCLNIYQDLPIARAYSQAHKEREAYLLTLQEQGNKETVYVQKFPSTHSQDAKHTILGWLGKPSATQAIYYESDTDVTPNEYESHIRHLYNLDFDFVLQNE